MRARYFDPLPCDNLWGNYGRYANTWVAGTDIIFTWNYRVKDGNGEACGEQGAGHAISAATLPPDGPFTLEIYVAATLVATYTITGTNTYTLVNATLVSIAGGTEPSAFYAVVYCTVGAYRGANAEAGLLRR